MMRHVLIVSGRALAAALALAACSDSVGPAADAHPRVIGLVAEPNPLNALSAIVRASVANADSVRVVYAGPGDTTAGATPFRASTGEDSLAVLGLAPNTTYRMALQTLRGSDTATFDVVRFTTGELPPYLQSTGMEFVGPARPSGFLLTAVGNGKTSFIVAFDGTGTVRWYREFDGDVVQETKQQFNGDFTTFVGASRGYDAVTGHFVEMHPDGGLVRTFELPLPIYVDGHELLLTGDPAAPDALFFTYTFRHVNLSDRGGPEDSLVVGHQLVRMSAAGDVQTIFDAWDHFDPSENIEPAGTTDFDHPNALAIDANGDYVVSWRNMAQISAIDHRTGSLLWRLGGTNGNVALAGDPLGFFSAQHSLRVLPNGHLLVFDNGTRHQPSESRAVEYAVDPGARTAAFVWQFRHVPPIYTQFTGSVQRLTNGNTIIGWTFGPPAQATEVTADGEVRWDAAVRVPTGNTVAAYRIIEIPSLYEFHAP